MLFLISFVLILISSYLLASILENKSFAKGFIYTVVICFSQIIFTTEILSIFKQFKLVPFLSLNIVSFILIYFVWKKFKKSLLKPNFKDYFCKIKNTFIKDKVLLILGASWLFFVIVSIILCSISVITNGDAKSYHVVRSAFWVLNSTINHFDCANIRSLIFPINSEIVYAWVILFTKKALLLGFFSLTFYLVYITSLYKIIHNLLGYSLRRTLWVIFIISSFACMVIQVSSVQTDLVIASLVLSGIYLFWDSFIHKNKISVFMSSLCFALAVGTKSSAGFLILASALFFIYLAYKYKNYKSLLSFSIYALLNFLVFSSYNYILNFFDFGNIFGTQGAIIAHKNLYGINGIFANAIKYLFLFFDFTGLNSQNILGQNIINIKYLILNALNLAQIPDGIYTDTVNEINNSLSESSAGCGILGFLLFLPCSIISLVKPIFKRHHKDIYNLLFSLFFIISFLMLSSSMSFMTYNIRYLNSIIFVTAPILVLSYIKSNKNIIKYLLVLIATFYLTCISTHIWARPLNKIMPEIMNRTKISDIQYTMDCLNWNTREANYDEMCKLDALIDYNFNDKNNKILFFANSSELTLRFVLKNINGSHIDLKHINDLDKINIDNYNILIIPKQHQDSTYIKNFSPEKIKYELNLKPNNQFKISLDNPNAQYACLYSGVDMQIITKNSNSIPYNEFCNFTKQFYKKYELEPVTEIGKYVFFVNKRNLPRTNRLN